MKTLAILAVLVSLGLMGCGVGETPVEKVEVKTEQYAKPDSVQGAIQNNPNLPPQAKEALLNQRGAK